MVLSDATQMIIQECESALASIDDRQGEALVEAILSAEKVYFYGVGRVFLCLQCICKRMAHLGVDAHCVGEITEPRITPADLLIVASGSGESLCQRPSPAKPSSWGPNWPGLGPTRKAPLPA